MVKKVEKMAISPEEQAIINNISALLNELKMLGMENEEVSPEMEEKQQEQTARPAEEMEEIGKGIEQTPSEGSTASDDAEKRDEENLTELTMENVDEIAKALMQIIGKTQKSQIKQSSNNEMIPVLNELVKTIKSINNRQEESEKVIESILKGLGVAKAIEDEEKKVEKSKQVRSSGELEKVLKHVISELGQEKLIEKNETYGARNQNEMARKSIKGWLGSVIQEDK